MAQRHSGGLLTVTGQLKRTFPEDGQGPEKGEKLEEWSHKTPLGGLGWLFLISMLFWGSRIPAVANSVRTIATPLRLG